jgi:3-phenylpropionate/trans-cinnamate dioxygenase ferredoxin reductase component
MSAPIVVVGGGLAAGTLVTQLRERGHEDPVVLITDEAHPPYERPPLSKDLLLGKGEPADAAVHEREWYAEHGVDLRTGTAVSTIDRDGRRVQAGDEWVDYDTLVLATGARPRRLPLADDSGVPVVYLRTLDDSLASAARQHGADVTVLESLDLPLLRVLGPEVAQVFADLHREHGVDLRTGVQVTSIAPSGGGARVTLGDDGAIDVDLLVVGVGVEPNTGLAEAGGLEIDNGIRTDSHLRTGDEHIYAIGDVANADHPVLGRPLRVEHWDTAIQHGKTLAATLSGTPTEASALPYFFTDQYDLGMEYVGNPGPEGYDRVELTGDVPGRQFRAWWVRDDRVVAGMHVNDWDAIDEIRRVVGSGEGPPEN